MSKARTLANLISDNAELADGQISVAEVVGAAPTANPTFTGNIGVAGNITNASGNLTLDVAGDIILDADGDDIQLKAGAFHFASITKPANNGVEFRAIGSDRDMFFKGNDGGSEITALTLDMSEAGAATFNSQVTIPTIAYVGTSIVHNGDANTSIDFNTDSQTFYSGGVRGLDINASGVYVNTSNQDMDFRVSSDNNSNMLFVDAAAEMVLVGGGTNTSGGARFKVSRGSDGEITLDSTSTSSNIVSYDRNGGVYHPINILASNVTINSDFLAEQSASIDSTVRATGNNTRALSKLQAHTSSGADINMTMGVFGDANRGEISTSTNHTLRLYVNNTPSKYLEIGTTGQIFTSHGMVINEDSHDSDFRVESNNVANMLFVDADNNRVGVGTGGPDSVMHVSGDFKATYYTPLNSTTQTSSANLNFWKLGRIYLIGERAAEIVLHGTKHGYGTGANIVGKTTILLRGGTSSTALDGIFYSEGQTSADSPPEVRYVNVGNDSFDIYVRYSAYSSIAHTVTTGGSWTPSLSNTGTGTAPTNSVAILPQRSLWLGSYEVLKQTQTETVINETSNDHDFRVESNNNANMLFVDAGNDRVGIGLSNPSYPLEVAGQTKVGFDNDSTSLIGTGYNGAFLHNGLNVPANTTTYTPHFEGTARVSGAGYVSHMTVGTKRDGTSSWNNCGFIAYGGNDAGPTQLWEFTVNGQFNSPSTKNFKIKHPLAELNETHDLYHAAIEGPNADLIYRGVVTLVAGSATVNIDTVSRMTEGTFVALTKDIQSFTSNETDWTPVRGSVSGNILTVEAQDNTSTASVSWMVVAKRNDFNVIDNETTDENGEFITERIQ